MRKVSLILFATTIGIVFSSANSVGRILAQDDLDRAAQQPNAAPPSCFDFEVRLTSFQRCRASRLRDHAYSSVSVGR